MSIDIIDVKRLRELTGVGITDAKKALVESKGDFDKALAAMRQKGLTKAEKRQERVAGAGIIGAYVHDGRIGVLVEVNCETDFVARNDLFKELVKNLTLQIAASAPLYVSANDMPKGQGDPKEICLLEQPFIKNPDQTVGDYVKEHIAKLGENIVVRRFRRMAIGEVND